MFRSDLNLYYKERRQLKIFLTQFRPALLLVDAKSALNAKHTKLASHAQRAKDVPVNFS
jgi:hypothetical protein